MALNVGALISGLGGLLGSKKAQVSPQSVSFLDPEALSEANQRLLAQLRDPLQNTGIPQESILGFRKALESSSRGGFEDAIRQTREAAAQRGFLASTPLLSKEADLGARRSAAIDEAIEKLLLQNEFLKRSELGQALHLAFQAAGQQAGPAASIALQNAKARGAGLTSLFGGLGDFAQSFFPQRNQQDDGRVRPTR